MRSASASSAGSTPASASSPPAAPAASCAAPGASPPSPRERVGAGPRGRAQRVEPAQALAREQQLLVLALVRVDRVDLAQLVVEQVELALALGGELEQGCLALLQRAHQRERRRACAQARGVIAGAEAVEDLQLRRGQRELAVLVLAVEREQHAAELAQVGYGRGATADVGARAPVGADAAREHELLRVGADALAELLAQALRQVEDPLHVSLAGSGAYDPRPRAPAQQQIERVREHGLAGAGLAGEHVQPWRQAQLRLLDQQQILDTELLQHATWSSSGRGRHRHRRGSRRAPATCRGARGPQ